ncbi:peptide chain release factor 1 [Acholeplasma laidlawii]|uniref:Peptide chain release factor 1 n=2 Tax=Acholeplasma laidlawii TaxID=2148 RepID=RF1_ACHLI|nr:peptide chain release factor 1 [Acholeplasma laidlawii]A9NEP7.1 RecName: Full=Peptide chain release factor 1; Short=RF-1 [Acholeplasma laidlawii PG-8A]ABX80827.1 peptide chain release factor RF-1 [Acholeplasma laidlawii PG-8A]NWH10614.1 peptide chain release factor 1 [Acholeplasma laidlawii]NWH11999.1 peptide chain release factor 1 [Acholeplasma laidlawii]NWH12592.1 peptide chain release factor 1 [Acholeplasma laidlawii]NWH14774.1 peptide chain release factor 1 [Acholeplasma laidlawii]
MFERLEVMRKTYYALQEKLASGISDVKEITKLMKELKSLEDAVVAYEKYLSLKEQLKDLEELLELETESSVLEMAKAEEKSLESDIENLEESLRILLLPKDPDDDKNVIIEIKGAAGGDEGNIFAGDLFKMYSKYAESMGWKVTLVNTTPGSSGGFAGIEFIISGENAFSYLKHESGVHRVQRVPETESQGRIHTSTAVVLALPEQEDIEYDVKWEDIRFDTYNSSGAGGQSVNTTYSAVRLTHIPTNVVVTSQEERSQHANKDRAYKLLVTRIYDKIQQEQLEKEGESRKALIGRGNRSEKIRTYNYPQNRVTDHRIGLTINRLDAIMEGRIDLIIEPLINEIQKEALEGQSK